MLTVRSMRTARTEMLQHAFLLNSGHKETYRRSLTSINQRKEVKILESTSTDWTNRNTP